MAQRRSTHSRAKPTSDIAQRRLERRLATGRKSDERWQRILEGASTAFRQFGYANTTLEDVAQLVGVNRGSLYYYVGTKEELLTALLWTPLQRMAANAKAIKGLDLPAEERLRRILEQYIADMVETPELFIFMAENIHRYLDRKEADEIAANADAYGKVIADLIREGAADGVFRSDIDPSLGMLWVVGAFNWTHRWYSPKGPLPLEEIGKAFTTLALDSLRPPRRR